MTQSANLPPGYWAITHRFAQRPTLPNGDLIAFFHTKSRRDMSGKIFMSLFVSGVLGDEVKVFAAYDEGSVHFG